MFAAVFHILKCHCPGHYTTFASGHHHVPYTANDSRVKISLKTMKITKVFPLEAFAMYRMQYVDHNL